MTSDARPLILGRAAAEDVTVPAALAGKLAAYLALLTKWNRTINLTALHLDPPDEAAIDRLIVEPLIAAAHVPQGARCLDIGSGGGSPALPVALARPDVAMTMVESRARKAAFLREAIRALGLGDASVAQCRAESLVQEGDDDEVFDVVLLRAVKVDTDLGAAIGHLTKPYGKAFVFGDPVGLDAAFAVESRISLPRGRALVVMARRR